MNTLMRSFNRLVWGVLWTAVLVASSYGAPRLRLSERQFNFGTVPQRSVVTHTFWLHSVGDEELKISKVIPGCGCATTQIEKNILPPGDSTRLEVIFDTKRYRGEILKRPTIVTNAPDSVTLLYFQADVTTDPDSTSPLVITPYKLDLSLHLLKDADSLEFLITNVASRDMTLTLIASPGEFVAIELPDSCPAGKSVAGLIRLTETGIAQSFKKSFTFEAGSKQRSHFTVPVVRYLKVPGVKSPTESE